MMAGAAHAKPERFAITLFRGVTDKTAGKPAVVAWPKLVERLTTFTTAANKADVEGWSPATFAPTCTCGEDGCPAERGHRTNENAIRISLLTLDVDKTADGTALDEAGARVALARFEELAVARVVHTTHSHRERPEVVSLRVAIQLSRPVDARDWEAFWAAAVAYIGVHVEPSCKNTGRFWYQPSCRPGAEAATWGKAFDGEPLDVDAILATVRKAEAPKATPRTAPINTEDAFDPFAFMASRYADAKRYEKRGRTCWDIDCPWEGEHSSSSYRDTVVSVEASGRLGFCCKHDHCVSRHWEDFRKFHFPEWVPFDERAPRDDRKRSDREPPPEYEQNRANVEHPNAPAAEVNASWSKPKPLGDHLPPVPAFDPQLLPADLYGWVCDIAHRMSVPLDMPAVAAMSALSVVAANARTIHPKRRDPWRVWPILWGATIAPPGKKKTPSTSEAFGPLQRLDIQSRNEFAKGEQSRKLDRLLLQTEIAVIKEGMKKAMKEKADQVEIRRELSEALDKQEEELRPRRFIAQDATIEAITTLIGSTPARRSYPLGVKWDELLGFFKMLDKEGHENDRTFMLESWSVTTRATDRIGRGSILTRDLALVVFGNATPEPFEEYVREASAGSGADGLLQRFQLMVYPDQSNEIRIVDEYRDAVAERRAREMFERLAAIDDEDDEKRPPALRFADKAQDFFFEWLGELERETSNSDEHVAIRSHLAKYASLMPSLALVCHLADGPGAEREPVTLHAAQLAAAWCSYLKAHAMRIYSLAVEPERALAAQIAAKIRTGKLTGEMTARELYRSAKVDADGAKDALALLEDLDWLRVRQVKQGGRPSQIVTFNPQGRAA